MNPAALDILGKFPDLASRSPEETARIGGALAGRLYPGLLVLLHGDLGAGKTTLAQAIGACLGVRGMKSPTFVIEAVHRLPGRAFSLVHADLYRLSDAEDACLQLEEYLDDGHAVLVEWGERWGRPPVDDRWDVVISQGDAAARTVGLAARGQRALAALSGAYLAALDGPDGRAGSCR